MRVENNLLEGILTEINYANVGLVSVNLILHLPSNGTDFSNHD